MEKLLSFPASLPDEMFYSLAVRYHRTNFNDSYRQTSAELFGCYSRTCGSIFPCCLDALVQKLAEGYTRDDLIENNTLLPIYRPFINEQIYTTAKNNMGYNSGEGIKLKLGLTASGFLKHASFRYCESCVADDILQYGVAYWHRTHMLPGVCACPRHARWLSTQCFGQVDDWRHMLLPAEGMGTPLSDCSNVCPAVGVAKLQQWGLANPELVKILIDRGFIRYSLAEQGLVKNNRLCMLGVIELINWQLAECPSIAEFGELVRGPDWALRLLRQRDRTVQPFCLYFLLWLLKKDIKSISDFAEAEVVFNSGFRNSRRNTTYLPSDKDLQAHRLAYSHASNVRCHDRPGYSWLYRNDRKWLMENFGGRGRRASNSRRVDWADRDRDFSRSIVSALHKLLASKPKPIKVTRSSLARVIKNGLMMLRCSSKLPRSTRLMDRVLESEHDFQLRKLKWAVKSLPYPQSLHASVVVRLAGIRVRRFDEKELNEVIEANRALFDSSQG